MHLVKITKGLLGIMAEEKSTSTEVLSTAKQMTPPDRVMYLRILQ